MTAIQKVMELSEEDRTAMGFAGREKADKKFNRQIVIQKYVNEVEMA